MMPAASNKTEKPCVEGGDPVKALFNILEKKARNLEKRKSKLDVIRSKKEAGDTLEKEQQETLKHYDAVHTSLDVMRELQKTFSAAMAEIEKMQKKQMKREKQEKAAIDQKRTADVLLFQCTLDSLGNDTVREHFKTGKHGAVVLTDDNLKSMDELYKLLTPSSMGEEGFSESLNSAAEHMNSLLEGRDRQVAGSTYKELLVNIRDIAKCGYFENVRQAEEETTAEATEEQEEEVEGEEEEESSAAVAAPSAADNLAEDEEAETVLSTQVQQPPDEVEDSSLAHSQVLQTGVPSHEAPAATFVAQMPVVSNPAMFSAPQMEQAPQPPVPKSRPLAEIVSAVEGTFSFLQESEIENKVESMPPHMDPHMDPAVVAAQPMIRPPSTPSQQPSQTNIMPSGFPAPPIVDQSGDNEAQDPLSLSQQSLTQSNLDFSGASQSFAQASLSHSQNLSGGVADSLFQSAVEESPAPQGSQQQQQQQQQQHTSHGMMGQALGAGEAAPQFELPPSIPMPPSQQQPQESTQLGGQEKKFQLNASATEFQSRSMYSQMPPSLQTISSQPPPPQNLNPQVPSQPQPQGPGHQPAAGHPESRPLPQPTAMHTDFPSPPNFAQAAGDFSQAANNYQAGGFQRGGRGGPGGYRGGSRGGRGGAGTNGTAMQNGFNNRPQNGNNRPGGNRGGAAFQGFPARNDYRPDGFQGYNSNGFGGPPYQKRGGGPGYPRGGGNRGAGGMRGGPPRGGPPRGAGGNRGGMNRPGNQ